MEKKKTQKEYYDEIIALAEENGRDDLVEFCKNRQEKLSRKSSSKKPTKVQVENENIKETILDILAELDTPTSATALATDARLGVSNQKITSLLTQLKNEGKVIREMEKGKALFSLPAEE